MKLFQLTPLIDVLVGNTEESKLLNLPLDHFTLVLERKAILTGYLFELFVKLVTIFCEVGEALLFLFLRLTQRKIALERGFRELLVLELLGLRLCDAFFAGVLVRLFIDLGVGRLIVGKNFRPFTRKDVARLGGKLCLKRTDGCLGLLNFRLVRRSVVPHPVIHVQKA